MPAPVSDPGHAGPAGAAPPFSPRRMGGETPPLGVHWSGRIDGTAGEADVPEGTTPMSLRRYRRRGWTLVELVLVIAIIGTLAGIAVPSTQGYVQRAKVGKAMGDIEAIQADLAGLEFLGKQIGRASCRERV